MLCLDSSTQIIRIQACQMSVTYMLARAITERGMYEFLKVWPPGFWATHVLVKTYRHHRGRFLCTGFQPKVIYRFPTSIETPYHIEICWGVKLGCVSTHQVKNREINVLPRVWGVLKYPTTSKNPKSMCWGVETSYHVKNPEIGVLRGVGTPLPPRKLWNRNDGRGVCWAPPSHISSEGGRDWVLGACLTQNGVCWHPPSRISDEGGCGNQVPGTCLAQNNGGGALKPLCLAFQLWEGCQAPASLETMAEMQWGPSVSCFKQGRG